jgi:two-component system response regulator ChvI
MTTATKESVSARPSSNPAPRPATSSDVEKRIRVAFVEDDDDYRETVSAELADHGYDAPLHQPGN